MKALKYITLHRLQKELEEKRCVQFCHSCVLRDLSREIAYLNVKKDMTVKSIEFLIRQLEEADNDNVKILAKRELIKEKKELKRFEKLLEEKTYDRQKREYLLEKARLQFQAIKEDIKKIEQKDIY